jgi:hypothetical protein
MKSFSQLSPAWLVVSTTATTLPPSISPPPALFPSVDQHLLHHISCFTPLVYTNMSTSAQPSPQRTPSLDRVDSQSTFTSFRDKMQRALSPNGRAHDGESAPSIGTRRPSLGRESLCRPHPPIKPSVCIFRVPREARVREPRGV